MRLEKIIKESEERSQKCGVGVSEGWTLRFFIDDQMIQQDRNVCTAKRILEISGQEWENTRLQGCTKIEVIRENPKEEIVKIWE
jgi:hypothetical protein